MKLKTRILLLSALLTIATGAMAWWVARDQALGIVAQWAMRYAEKQVLYDKVRMMQPYCARLPCRANWPIRS
jgi:hypothetical protein